MSVHFAYHESEVFFTLAISSLNNSCTVSKSLLTGSKWASTFTNWGDDVNVTSATGSQVFAENNSTFIFKVLHVFTCYVNNLIKVFNIFYLI